MGYGKGGAVAPAPCPHSGQASDRGGVRTQPVTGAQKPEARVQALVALCLPRGGAQAPSGGCERSDGRRAPPPITPVGGGKRGETAPAPRPHSGQASDWGGVRTRPGGAGSPMEEPVHRLFIPSASRRKAQAPIEGCVGSKTADGSPQMVGAISGDRPGRAETVTAPSPGSGARVSRPESDATAVAPSPAGGDFMHTGVPGKCCQTSQKKGGCRTQPHSPGACGLRPCWCRRRVVPSRGFLSTRLRPN